jgi:hypothetical protein
MKFLHHRRVTSMHGHSSHNTTIIVFYLIYQLHVSAIVNSAIIRLDTIIRETVQYSVIQYNLQCGGGGRDPVYSRFWRRVCEW